MISGCEVYWKLARKAEEQEEQVDFFAWMVKAQNHKKSCDECRKAVKKQAEKEYTEKHGWIP